MIPRAGRVSCADFPAREGGCLGAAETRRLSIPATAEGVKTALDALEGLWSAQGISRAVTWPVEVSLDEVLANVVHHALSGRGDSARVDLELQLDPGEPPRCEVRVVDDGPEFDPLGAATPDTALGVDERPVGGLGIELVKRLMDEVHYERKDGRNRLRLVRHLVVIDERGE